MSIVAASRPGHLKSSPSESLCEDAKSSHLKRVVVEGEDDVDCKVQCSQAVSSRIDLDSKDVSLSEYVANISFDRSHAESERR